MLTLLVNPPAASSADPHAMSAFIDRQRAQLSADQYYSMPMEHLGMMSILAACRDRDIDVASVNGIVEGHSSPAETFARMLEVVESKGAAAPAVVGISCIYKWEEVAWLCQEVKRVWPKTRVVIGNSFATLNALRVLQACDDVDAVVIGDGELAFPAYIEEVALGHEPELKGVVTRTASGPGALTPAVAPMSDLPWPARDELPAVRRAGFAPAISMSRGCPYRCTFCGTGAASDLIGRDGYRLRDVEDAVDEIEALVRDFGVPFLSISDDLFLSKHPASQERARDFAELLLKRRVEVKFMIDARVDSTSDRDLMRLLHRAGLVRIYMGIETGSYEQLVAYRKRHVKREEDPAQRIHDLAADGIEVIPGTIMFHPTVKPPELRETVRLLAETGYGMPGKLTDRMVAYAGTPLYQDYSSKGLLDAEWPVGEWHFQDPRANDFYDDVIGYLQAHPEADFAQASMFFLHRLERWEADLDTDLEAGLSPVG